MCLGLESVNLGHTCWALEKSYSLADLLEVDTELMMLVSVQFWVVSGTIVVTVVEFTEPLAPEVQSLAQ